MLDRLQRRIDWGRTLIAEKLGNSYKLNYLNQGLLNFIDVGSIGGLPPPWRSNAKFVKFLLNFDPFDPVSRTANSLTYDTAVWDEDTTLPFYVYKGFQQTGSSLFVQNAEYVRENFEMLRQRGDPRLADTWFERSALVKTLEIKCRRLDGLLSEVLPEVPFHFMKIDAQGAEFRILKGAEAMLSRTCLGLHLELFSLPLYEGIVLQEEVAAHLARFGFELVKKFPPHGSFESQNDCLFLKAGANTELLKIVRDVYAI